MSYVSLRPMVGKKSGKIMAEEWLRYRVEKRAFLQILPEAENKSSQIFEVILFKKIGNFTKNQLKILINQL